MRILDISNLGFYLFLVFNSEEVIAYYHEDYCCT